MDIGVRRAISLRKFWRARDAAVQARPDLALIDMGVGEPDGMAYPGVVNTLSEQAAMPENRGYSDNGPLEFKEAVARYMARVYGVEVSRSRNGD